MLPPPSLTVVQMLASEETIEEVPCTCGAKDWHKQQKKDHTTATTIEAKQSANDPAAASSKLHRSLWRKLLGVGPKCICQKRRAISSSTTTRTKPGLIEIPAEYVGCTAVTVSGKRVPFSRDMQQQCRKSWTPLDAIEEDE
ncbi:hypothetical protein F441_00753 [Phytophthora nicotianae CJ01A1]|uniref:Uncharacterized protein n=5 Tax=Phytophthora nicotianae TaxID=4792 RepID=V9G286_PHYNI|nr:hypothetical protein F443_00765 [Phytophthora nicotianae P1569]ETK96605.1 hypothetical protein L915_00711 [Phytophthora nicotianae]ETO85561.1 hypothetical protein F444_00766 [Phytophthora nicotianae P1976]ETP26609.1 hypothetical protein F441_00753 [Phytophthora nicotianae CJ01A1]ETP54605.1 hypothetical protein F442_00713 [Phytophthora nicotianae P10297]